MFVGWAAWDLPVQIKNACLNTVTSAHIRARIEQAVPLKPAPGSQRAVWSGTSVGVGRGLAVSNSQGSVHMGLVPSEGAGAGLQGAPRHGLWSLGRGGEGTNLDSRRHHLRRGTCASH